MCALQLSEGGVPLVQAMCGSKPLARAKGDWALPLCRLRIDGNFLCGLRAMWCLLHDLQVAGTDCGGHVRVQRETWPATIGGLSGLHLWPQSPQGLAKKKEGNATKHHTLLLSLSGNIPSLQLPLPNTLEPLRHLITIPSQDPTTRNNWCSTSCVG